MIPEADPQISDLISGGSQKSDRFVAVGAGTPGLTTTLLLLHAVTVYTEQRVGMHAFTTCRYEEL